MRKTIWRKFLSIVCPTSIGMGDLISSINSSTDEKTKGGRPKIHSRSTEGITLFLVPVHSYRKGLFQSTKDQRDYRMDGKKEFLEPYTIMSHEYFDCHVCRYVALHRNLSREEFQPIVRETLRLNYLLLLEMVYASQLRGYSLVLNPYG